MNETINDVHLIPFGKYKGKTLEEVKNDVQYFEWLQSQGWFKEKYDNFYQVVINNFNEPTETPEHNKIQAMFLDDEFRCEFFNHFINRSCDNIHRISLLGWEYEGFFVKEKSAQDIKVSFEDFSIDIKLESTINYIGIAKSKTQKIENYEVNILALIFIEIKPQIGDDWPSVLRDVKRIAFGVNSTKDRKIFRSLFYKNYTGIGVSEDEFRKVFENENIIPIKLSEITGDKK